MDNCLGKKQAPEFNLRLGVELVLQLTKDLEWSLTTVYFDNFFNNFFNSQKLIEKLFQKSIHRIGTVWANIKQIMPKMIDDKQMKKGNSELLFSGNTMVCKWVDNW